MPMAMEESRQAQFLSNANMDMATFLERRMSRVSREGNHIPDVFNTGGEHHKPFESQSKTSMWDGPVFPQVHVRKHILTGQKNIKYSRKYLMNIFQSPSC